MSTVGSLLVRIGLDTKPLDAGVARAKGALATLDSAHGQSMSTAAKARIAVGAAGAAMATGAAALGIDAIKSAAQFDDAMLLIQTQAGASADEVERMKQVVLGMAGQVGQAPEALAGALFHVESAGFRGAAAEQVLSTAAKGAAVGHADLTSVTNALTAAMNSGVKGVQDASQAMGTLNAVVGAGNMTMDDLTAAMGTGVLSTAKNFGVSIQSAGAAIAAMANQGIPAVDAATRLNSAMRLMAAPTGAAVKELKSIGLTSTTLAADLRSPGGVLTAVTDLKAHMEKAGLSATQQAALLTKAFGGKQAGGILTLVGGLDKLKTAQDQVTKGAGDFGAAWAATQADEGQKAAEMKASWDSATTSLGSALLPAVNELLSAILPVVQAFAGWMKDNPQLAATILAIVGGVGALMGVLAVLGPAIAAVAAVGLGPILLIGAAIAAIIAVVVLVATHFDQLKAGIGVVVNFLVGLFQGLVGIVTGVFGAIGNAISGALAAIGNVIGQAVDLWVTIYVRIPQRIAGFVVGVVQKFVELAQRGLALVTSFVGSVVSFILSIPGKVVGLIAGVLGTFTRLNQQIGQAVLGMVGGVVGMVLGIPGKVVGLVGSFADIAGRAVKAFVDVIAGLPGKVAGIIGSVGSTIGGALSSVIPHFATGAWSVPATTLAVVHAGEMIIPADRAAGIRSSASRTGGPAAAASPAAAAGSRSQVVNITVNNPLPEPASTSLRREVDKMQRLTAFGY